MSAASQAPTNNAKAAPEPTRDELDELLLCARYGDEQDLSDMRHFTAQYGTRWLADARDDNGNTCLHLAGANGHADIVSFLLQHLTEDALTTTNNAQSTPLHWIALNFHLNVLQLVCPKLPPSAFEIKNLKGKTALQEAEEATESFIVPATTSQGPTGESDVTSPRAKERVRREKVVGYLLQCMGLGVKERSTELKEDGDKDGESSTEIDKDNAETMQRLAKEAERIQLEEQASKS
ncbi:hypothetical protein OIV83_004420 [Microbotryomycetes sp. JL201]|nr:hypothetical protein OIV83_004420 [Microbotryomycetes sp. JL201]